MSDKKTHEVDAMAQVIARLAKGKLQINVTEGIVIVVKTELFTSTL